MGKLDKIDTKKLAIIVGLALAACLVLYVIIR